MRYGGFPRCLLDWIEGSWCVSREVRKGNKIKKDKIKYNCMCCAVNKRDKGRRGGNLYEERERNELNED